MTRSGPHLCIAGPRAVLGVAPVCVRDNDHRCVVPLQRTGTQCVSRPPEQAHRVPEQETAAQAEGLDDCINSDKAVSVTRTIQPRLDLLARLSEASVRGVVQSRLDCNNVRSCKQEEPLCGLPARVLATSLKAAPPAMR